MEEFIVLLLLAQKQRLDSALTFDDTAILQSLSEIKAELAQIKSQLNNTSDMQIAQLQITPSYAHTGTWSVQLSALSNITDNDNSSSTNYGEIVAATNSVGFFIIDLGSVVSSPFSIIEFLIAIQNTNGTAAYWALEIEQQGSWENIWGEYRVVPSNGDTQVLKTLVVKGDWQRIRFVLRDVGSWAPRIKVHSLRIFTVTS